MLLATWHQHNLQFKRPITTSRDTLTQKPSWFLLLKETKTLKIGIGECSPLAGLSIDDLTQFENKLTEVCQEINAYQTNFLKTLQTFPAIQCGLENALLALESKENTLFTTPFTQGKQVIPINGLIWMASKANMLQQINKKLAQGFKCLKLKIGALDFEEEYGLLRTIRRQYSVDDIEIRVDANGAFHQDHALEKLQRLADLQLHSIEQPIAAGQFETMAELVEKSPLPIALDEELIGLYQQHKRIELLDCIQPDYIILKPSFLGGFYQTKQWITLAQQRNMKWWITSALESNLGLNVLAQWTSTLNNPLPQGLGTGLLYSNNLPSALSIHRGELHFSPDYPLNEAWNTFFNAKV